MRKRSLRRPRALVLAAVAALGVATAFWLPSRADTAEAAVGPQTWADEFNLPAGTPVDTGKWTHEIGGGGWGNNERQYYTNATSNSVHDGAGNLVITARRDNPNNFQCHYGRCEYTSARLITSGKFAQTYGKVEARIKIPRGQGIWPAFWMLGTDIGSVGWPNSGEIDIMENIGKEPNTVYGTVHGPGYSGGAGITGSRNIGRPLADDFHTYGIEWSPNLIRWFLDGAEYHRITPANLNGNRWVFDKPHFLLLNVAVGGNWPGYPDATTQFPQQMIVDYVRVNSWTTGTPPTTTAPTTRPPTTAPTTRPPTTPPTTAPTTTRPPTTAPTTAPPAGNAWTPYTAYTVGQVVTHNGVRYQVRQSHTSLPGWEPPNVLALFLPL